MRALLLVTPIDTTGCTGLLDFDSYELWQLVDQTLPDPHGKDFTRGIFESRDLVEVVVIKAVVQWLERRLEISEILNPTADIPDRALDHDPQLIGMAVKSSALVADWHIGQSVR
jgi:hypothetical protein